MKKMLSVRLLHILKGAELTSLPDMRKPLPRDVNRKSIRPNGRDIIVSAHDVS